jgi:hypothetical protein
MPEIPPVTPITAIKIVIGSMDTPFRAKGAVIETAPKGITLTKE